MFVSGHCVFRVAVGYVTRFLDTGTVQYMWHLTSALRLSATVLEAFSPESKKRFSSAKFLVDQPVLYVERRYTHHSFSTRKTCIL